MNIDPRIIEILERLEDYGYEANIVGGAVRDLLLNKEIIDIDINTNASSNSIKQLFSDYPLYDIGKELGTVTLIMDNYKVDITPYRKENDYINHRRPSSVTLSDSLKEDLSRRDFTINALCINSSLEIIDYFDGINDLNNKIIKAIGNPYNRFEEDALRILRAIRFKAVLGFEIDHQTKNAIFDLKDLLKYISPERKKEELLKTLAGQYVQNVINEYISVFRMFIPINTVSYMIDLFRKPLYRLAYLLENTDCLKDLKFSKHEINFVNSLIVAKNINVEDNYEFIKCLGESTDTDGIIEFLSQCHRLDFRIKYETLKQYCINANSLDINGHELEEFGYKDEQIRFVKDALVDRVHKQLIENNNSAIKEYLSKNDILKLWN